MTEAVSLSAQRRHVLGTGGARATRREGRIPAVIYDDRRESVAISLDLREFDRHARSHTFFSQVFEIDVEGTKNRVLPREVQSHPVTGAFLHVDFVRLSAKGRVHIEVEVRFVNEATCPGLKRGGTLNVVRHSLELYCPADAIPHAVEVDLASLDVGDAVHLKDLVLPAGSESAIADPELTIASITAPTVAKEGAEGAAGETPAGA